MNPLSKSLILTYHSIERYASRTARDPSNCAIELVIALRNQSAMINYYMAREQGFPVTRSYEGDTYHVWYDPKVDDTLLAIVTRGGAVKTVLRKDVYSYNNPGLKDREDNHRREVSYSYDEPKRAFRSKRKRRRTKPVPRVHDEYER